MPNEFENTEYFQLLSEHSQTWHLGGSAATDALLSRLENPRKMTLLEIGCGKGQTLRQLQEMGIASVMAMDASPQMLRWAGEALQLPNQHVLLSHADAHQVPAADDSFDVVLIESVLIFCDLASVLAEVHRVLKPGGILLLNELVVLNEVILDHVEKIDAFIGSPVLTLHTRAQWHAAFQQAGFDVAWELQGKLPRLKLFLFLHTLGLVDVVRDEAVLTYALYHLMARIT